MAKSKRRTSKTVVQELDMAEHSTRLRSLPSTTWVQLKKTLTWVGVLMLLGILGWIALGH